LSWGRKGGEGEAPDLSSPPVLPPLPSRLYGQPVPSQDRWN
jgi:hypothetical protein